MPPPAGWSSPTSCPRCSPASTSLARHRALHLRGRPQGDVRRRVGRPAVDGVPRDASIPRLAALRDRLYDRALPPGTPGGTPLPRVGGDARSAAKASRSRWAAFDAHYGAVGAGIRPGTLVKIIGTSTCDCAVLPPSGNERATCRRFRASAASCHGSIMPGYFGIEAGQSAVGDLLNWWVDAVCEGDERAASRSCQRKPRRCAPGESGLLALDWNNGNRTILVDPRLTGLIARADAAHDARRDLPRADRGHGVRRARDHRSHPRVRRGRSIASSAAAASPRRTTSSCRSTPTCSASRC